MAVGGLGLIIGGIIIYRELRDKRRDAQRASSYVQPTPTYQTTVEQPTYQPIAQAQPITTEFKPKFCTSCGGKIEEGMTFCSNCGASI